MNLTRYFTQLEFYPDDTSLGPRIQTRRQLWTIGSYLSLAAGLFARQIVKFPEVQTNSVNWNWGVLAASFLIALAVFSPAMRYLNRHRKKPGVEHVLASFSLGFFLNLVLDKLVRFL